MRALRGRVNRLYPELLLFETPQQQRKAFRRSMRWKLLSLRFWGWILLLVIALMVVEEIAKWLFARYFTDPRTLERILFWGRAVVLGAAAVDLYMWVPRKSVRRSLRQQLTELGIPVCSKCGYDLRGRTEAWCPGCGAGLKADPPKTGPSQGSATDSVN